MAALTLQDVWAGTPLTAFPAPFTLFLSAPSFKTFSQLIKTPFITPPILANFTDNKERSCYILKQPFDLGS